MRWNRWISMGCAVLGVCVAGVGQLKAQLPPVPAGATLVGPGGLYGPRGLKFGPDGNLYVATSGTANPQTGEMTTTCPLMPGGPPAPVPGGPYFGDTSATILKIDPQGNQSTLATGFPSTFNSPTQSGYGVGDVRFWTVSCTR
jgi:hypothetical protein